MRRLLIVGAGISGLTLIRALRGANWSIDVAERATQFQSLGVGIVIHPNGMRVLAQLGLGDRVLAASNVLEQMTLLRQEVVLRLPLPEIWAGVPHPTVSILRPALQEILLQGALGGDVDQVRLRMGCQVRDVDLSGRCPLVTFADGTRASYDLIVGADGVHSAVRRSLPCGAAAVSTDLFYFRFPARNVIGLSSSDWSTTERSGASYGFIPLTGGQVHCFVQLREAQAPCPRGQETDYFAAHLCGWSSALQASFAARCGLVHGDFAWMVRPVYWGHGACVLLGDAAHAISPTLSEGGSLAMEDSLVLARVLQKAAEIPEVLEQYREARQARVEWAYRMALAQVNSARRGRVPGAHVDSAMAAQHMRQMYEPLRENPLASLRS